MEYSVLRIASGTMYQSDSRLPSDIDTLTAKLDRLSLSASAFSIQPPPPLTLEGIPTELKLELLTHLPDIPSLSALVHASPIFHQVYLNYRERILTAAILDGVRSRVKYSALGHQQEHVDELETTIKKLEAKYCRVNAILKRRIKERIQKGKAELTIKKAALGQVELTPPQYKALCTVMSIIRWKAGDSCAGRCFHRTTEPHIKVWHSIEDKPCIRVYPVDLNHGRMTGNDICDKKFCVKASWSLEGDEALDTILGVIEVPKELYFDELYFYELSDVSEDDDSEDEVDGTAS